MAVIDLTDKPTAASEASKGIVDMINAMANAKTAQTELQKTVMLHQVQQKMDLQENASKLQQGVESNINQKQANVNWLEQMGGGDSSTPTATTNNGLNAGSGTADSGTPAAMASPMAGVVNPAAPQPAPQAPQSPTPMLTAAAQPKPSPVLNGITPTPINSGTVTAPQAPVQQPSPQYQNLGYKPIEAQQLVAQRQASGQTINMGDRAYVGALQKVKAGTASQGEIDLVNKMNNKDGSASAPASAPIPSSTQMSPVQKGLRNIEKTQGLPEGSMWMNPATGDPEVSPIWQKKVEALNTAQAQYLVMQPQRDQQTAEVFNKALDPSYYRAGAFGDSKKVFDRGEALQSLYNAGSAQPGGLDKRQIEELTIGYQNMLSRGGNSVTQVDALLPKSIVGNVNALTEWLTNNPKGSDQMKFVDRVHSGIEREMATVQTQMDRTRMSRIATFDPWIQRNPEQARNMMMSYGINPDEYQKYKDNGFKQETAVQGSIPSFNSEQDAAAAGLSDGTPITINGVKGKWSNK